MSATSSAMDRQEKRRRLKGVVGVKGVSTSALAEILKKVNKDGIAPASRWQIGNLLSKELDEVRHTIKISLDDGEVFEWVVCKVDLMFQYYAKECPVFKAILSEALVAARGRPVRSIWYLDEVVPGNVLRPDNRRKVWSIYLSLVEFGKNRMSQEPLWFPVAVLRSSVVAKVPGGLSSCLRMLLNATLFEPTNLAGAGAAIMLDRPTLLRIKISAIVGDEAALKSIWGSKGAAGTKPCFYCANLVAMQAGISSDCPGLIDIACCDPARFQAYSDRDVWAAFDDLASKRHQVSKKEFSVLEQAAGKGVVHKQQYQRSNAHTSPNIGTIHMC